MLKVRFIGRGMRMEFHHPEYRTPIVTSPIPRNPGAHPVEHVADRNARVDRHGISDQATRYSHCESFLQEADDEQNETRQTC
jgi:hypothetical protein